VGGAGVAAGAGLVFGDVPDVCQYFGSSRYLGLNGRRRTYQCGQSSVASGVMRGAIEAAVMFGVVRRARTGVEPLGLPPVVDDEMVGLGADVGGWVWCFDCERLVSGDEVSSGCEEIFVAPRDGEAGCEAASELKRSSSSFAKADLRLPGGREGVMVAVEAIIEVEVVELEDLGIVRMSRIVLVYSGSFE
jgi:hypothetical protein